MYLDKDDLVTSSIIAFLIAIVVFVFSIKTFRWLSSENYVPDKGLSSHVWVEKPTCILSVSFKQLVWVHSRFSNQISDYFNL